VTSAGSFERDARLSDAAAPSATHG